MVTDQDWWPVQRTRNLLHTEPDHQLTKRVRLEITRSKRAIKEASQKEQTSDHPKIIVACQKTRQEHEDRIGLLSRQIDDLKAGGEAK